MFIHSMNMFVHLLLPHLICLSTEPLYQEYRATVITKEIRRQTVCRNISKTSVDYAMDWTARRTGTAAGNGATRSSPVPSPGQSTLWQELPAVRDSGVLETLTPEQCKYQEVRDRSKERRAKVLGRGHAKKSMMWGGEKRERRYQVFNHILK